MQKLKKLKKKVLVSTLGTVALVVISFIYFFLVATRADAAWFDDAWRYRVAIPISAHTTTENNVYLDLTGSNGIDTTDTSKFQADCGDVRFTDSGGNILPYYLTTACGLAQTGFHVFLSTFSAGAQTIYYYYGNPTAPNGFSTTDFMTAATGVTLGTRGSETNAPTSPLAFWKFDDGNGQSITNSMGTTNTGTLGPDGTSTSTDPTWATEDMCVSGKCLNFVGTSSQYVNFSSSIASVKSVAFWVRPTSTTTSFAVLNGAAGNASISVSSGVISVGAGFSSPTVYVNGLASTTLVANAWQYVVVTTGTGIAASNIVLGRVDTGYLNGFIDEVKIYGDVLPAGIVKSNYASGMGKMGPVKGSSATLGSSKTSTNALSNGLVGYWKMDETSGSPLDASGNANTGTWTGGATNATGKFGNGGTFDGTGDYVSAPDIGL
jgi:hypothetical protein